MAIYRMLAEGVFEPEAARAMATAYERVCIALEIDDRKDPLTEIIAKKIIERAKAGELDVDGLCDAALKEIGSEP